MQSVALLLVPLFATQPQEHKRGTLLRGAVRKLGLMKGKARVSEKSVERRHLRNLEPDGDAEAWRVLLLAEDPPTDDDLAGVCWAYLRMCRLMHELAIAESIAGRAWSALFDTLYAVSAVECARSSQ